MGVVPLMLLFTLFLALGLASPPAVTATGILDEPMEARRADRLRLGATSELMPPARVPERVARSRATAPRITARVAPPLPRRTPAKRPADSARPSAAPSEDQ